MEPGASILHRGLDVHKEGIDIADAALCRSRFSLARRAEKPGMRLIAPEQAI